MASRQIALVLIVALLLPAGLVLAQDAPDYKPLVGVWAWRPTRDWAAVLTIQSVTEQGLVTAEWKDPHWGTIPFKTQAKSEDGKITIRFGRSTKYTLAYDRKDDSLGGPVTDLPPKYTGPEWQTTNFRRTK